MKLWNWAFRAIWSLPFISRGSFVHLNLCAIWVFTRKHCNRFVSLYILTYCTVKAVFNWGTVHFYFCYLALPPLSSASKQLLVAPMSSGADDDLDNGRTFVCIHLHVLNGGLFVQPAVEKHTHVTTRAPLIQMIRWHRQSHLSWGELRLTLRSKICFPVAFKISSSTASFSCSKPLPSRADIGRAASSADS